MRLITLFIAVFFVSTASADIHDRINACERSGGGSCVYDLLRELANSRQGNHKVLKIYNGWQCSGSSVLEIPIFANRRKTIRNCKDQLKDLTSIYVFNSYKLEEKPCNTTNTYLNSATNRMSFCDNIFNYAR